MYPDFNCPARPAHPGRITFVDADGTERVESADQLPDWLKFAAAADGRVVPVVRVARVAGEHGVSVRSFGADGRLLAVTLSAAAPRTEPVHSARSPLSRRPEPRPAATAGGWF